MVTSRYKKPQNKEDSDGQHLKTSQDEIDN